MEGEWKTPLPQCYTSQKSPVLIGLKSSLLWVIDWIDSLESKVVSPDGKKKSLEYGLWFSNCWSCLKLLFSSSTALFWPFYGFPEVKSIHFKCFLLRSIVKWYFSCHSVSCLQTQSFFRKWLSRTYVPANIRQEKRPLEQIEVLDFNSCILQNEFLDVSANFMEVNITLFDILVLTCL